MVGHHAAVHDSRTQDAGVVGTVQHQMYEMLGELFSGARLDAAVSMLTGVVACPSLMFGTLPDDDVIEAAVDIVLQAGGAA